MKDKNKEKNVSYQHLVITSEWKDSHLLKSGKNNKCSFVKKSEYPTLGSTKGNCYINEWVVL